MKADSIFFTSMTSPLSLAYTADGSSPRSAAPGIVGTSAAFGNVGCYRSAGPAGLARVSILLHLWKNAHRRVNGQRQPVALLPARQLAEVFHGPLGFPSLPPPAVGSPDFAER